MAMTPPDTSPHEPFTLDQLSPQPPKKRRTGLIVGAVVGGLVVIAATATATVALSGGGNDKPGATPTSAAQTYFPPPAVKTATVAQYASAVSPPIKSLRETYQQYKAGGCLLDAESSASLACSIQTRTLDIEAQTLAITITGAAKEGVPAYIGQPPAEIKQLVGDTLYAAQDLDETISPDGKYEAPILFQSLTRLMTTLDKWDPYLG